jgi:hypothetical protein
MRELSGAYPVRLPVWWGRRGPSGPHPELDGITGRFIVIRHPKKFGRFEGFLARLFKAPNELRRPLDDLNSLLWELCDGHRSFEEICELMDSTFHERIAPVADRTESALIRFNQLGLIGLSKTPHDGNWERGPGHDPSGDLADPDEKLGLDWHSSSH